MGVAGFGCWWGTGLCEKKYSRPAVSPLKCQKVEDRPPNVGGCVRTEKIQFRVMVGDGHVMRDIPQQKSITIHESTDLALPLVVFALLDTGVIVSGDHGSAILLTCPIFKQR